MCRLNRGLTRITWMTRILVLFTVKPNTLSSLQFGMLGFAIPIETNGSQKAAFCV